jgi:hypothetical protein
VIGQRFDSRVGKSYASNVFASYLKACSRKVDLASYRPVFDVAFFYSYMVRYHDYN